MVEGENRPPTEDCRNQPDWKRRLGEAMGLRRAAFITDLKNFHEEEVGLFSFCVLVTETPYLTGTMQRTHRADGLGGASWSCRDLKKVLQDGVSVP